MSNTEENQKEEELYYQRGYAGLWLPMDATADQEAEYNQGAIDRKRERES